LVQALVHDRRRGLARRRRDRQAEKEVTRVRGTPQLRGVFEDITTILDKGPAVASQVSAIITKIYPFLGTVRKIVDDPALPQVVQRIEVINAMPSTATGLPGSIVVSAPGVGLKHLLAPLDAYIYARRNPWAPWAIGAGIVLVIGGIGYRLGQRKARP
jgi:hypothetical protein